MLQEDNISFQWMFLTKYPRSYSNYNESSRKAQLLINALRHPDINYTLTRIDIGKEGVSYIEYLLSKVNDGQYICQLETTSGDTKHVIAVDVGRNVILDASETHALKFNRDNLDYCAGNKYFGIRKIVYCYQLQKRNDV